MRTDRLTEEDFIEAENCEDVKHQNKPVGKACCLILFHKFDKLETLNHYKVTNTAFLRAQISMMKGFEVGNSGRRFNLNRSDEKILEQWCLEMLDLGDTLFTWKVVNLVWIIFYSSELILSIYPGPNAGRQVHSSN